MDRILIIDDEDVVLTAFKSLVESEGYETILARSGEAALEILDNETPDLVVADIKMPGMDGLTVLDKIMERLPRIPVVVMTAHGTTDTAIEALKRGAFEYLLKPFNPEKMLKVISDGMECVRLMQRTVRMGLPEEQMDDDVLLGNCPAMQEVYKAIGRVAATDATVLISGETGTGKELVARAIYQHSQRSEKPMLIINCTAIPETLLESELFGHEKAAFTGAQGRRVGKFEQAQGGTIFMDEVGDIPLAVQSKILRILQQKTFQRVGGNETLQSDVRVIAATNRNLAEAIREKAFREDLYHRLNVFSISLPPLRDRGNDIELLLEYFVKKFAHKLEVDPPVVAPEALEILTQHTWPGNVREMEHCIHRALISTKGFPIQAKHILKVFDTAPQDPTERKTQEPQTIQELISKAFNSSSEDGAFAQCMGGFEKSVILEALRRSAGNRTKAAKLLGLTRPTLHAKLHRHEIKMEQNIQ